MKTNQTNTHIVQYLIRHKKLELQDLNIEQYVEMLPIFIYRGFIKVGFGLDPTPRRSEA